MDPRRHRGPARGRHRHREPPRDLQLARVLAAYRRPLLRHPQHQLRGAGHGCPAVGVHPRALRAPAPRGARRCGRRARHRHRGRRPARPRRRRRRRAHPRARVRADNGQRCRGSRCRGARLPWSPAPPLPSSSSAPPSTCCAHPEAHTHLGPLRGLAPQGRFPRAHDHHRPQGGGQPPHPEGVDLDVGASDRVGVPALPPGVAGAVPPAAPAPLGPAGHCRVRPGPRSGGLSHQRLGSGAGGARVLLRRAVHDASRPRAAALAGGAGASCRAAAGA